LASLAKVLPNPKEERDLRERERALTVEEQRLSRALGQALGTPEAGEGWVEVGQVRKALPADGVLIEIAPFEPAEARSGGTAWGRTSAAASAGSSAPTANCGRCPGRPCPWGTATPSRNTPSVMRSAAGTCWPGLRRCRRPPRSSSAPSTTAPGPRRARSFRR